jgi:hypothetical protein
MIGYKKSIKSNIDHEHDFNGIATLNVCERFYPHP